MEATCERDRVTGIVLAGVHQWDGAALDSEVPRPLLPIAQAPLISYPLEWLRAGGVRKVTVCANSASRLVRQCLGDGRRLGIDVNYYEDWTPRGPAGCIHDAGLCDGAETCVVVDGTIIPLFDLSAMLAAHAQAGASVSVAVDVAAPGLMRPVGAYVFEREALRQIPPTGYQDIKEILLPRLYQQGERVRAYPTGGSCPRVRGLASYIAVCGWVLERLAERELPPEFCRRGEARVHLTATIDPSAALLGPVLVDAGAHIDENATVVGPTTIGAGCAIEAAAVVSRSVLWDGCRIGRASLVDQCVVGHTAQVGASARFHGQFVASVAEDGPSLLERLIARGRAPAGQAAAAWTGSKQVLSSKDRI